MKYILSYLMGRRMDPRLWLPNLRLAEFLYRRQGEKSHWGCGRVLCMPASLQSPRVSISHNYNHKIPTLLFMELHFFRCIACLFCYINTWIKFLPSFRKQLMLYLSKEDRNALTQILLFYVQRYIWTELTL